MRKIVLFVLLLSLLVIPSVVQAKSGSAVIPFYYIEKSSNHTDKTILYISNITDQPISVDITLFTKEGTIFKDTAGDHIFISNVSSYSLNNINSTLSFNLNSNATTYIVLKSELTTQKYGYGVIEWSQDSNNTYGLVASGSYLQARPGTSRFAMQINDSKPF